MWIELDRGTYDFPTELGLFVVGYKITAKLGWFRTWHLCARLGSWRFLNIIRVAEVRLFHHASCYKWVKRKDLPGVSVQMDGHQYVFSFFIHHESQAMLMWVVAVDEFCLKLWGKDNGNGAINNWDALATACMIWRSSTHLQWLNFLKM
jgi:hypothetical protein